MAHLHHPPYDPYYQLAQPPLQEVLTAAGATDWNGGGINTLFVSGLPDDVKAREIHNLFRRRPGFESCQLKYTGRGNQVVELMLLLTSELRKRPPILTNNQVMMDRLEKAAAGGVQPCSTLFIANLGPNCTEDELRQVLSGYPGFNLLKLRARGGMPVAFADFKEVEQAIQVMEDLQDTLLPSSDRGGMHIEFARSKMRKH
ncbi:hypothetical protein Tsubulata_030117 [Turnera subulata]|uniref:RRM domain-containing protein n=1 Tax=Turnera subulata TaxID=218843 RepID=A0A9Q0JBW9_9ROSI|nr:hypothetical protein Tsubulata_030117 [Turnera subulata]